ncbi:MAG: 3-oxoacyl-[acyl-carrier-protein] reductase [Gemmatimonadaceae bacterium]|nr:3-oxoacyl-[acyl-carrier-protein] reductase [Gemmatimonadaceae bacterium]
MSEATSGIGATGGLSISLNGRVALVTGSTRGIGRSIAAALARAGARVAVSGREQSKADAVAAELAQETGADVRGFAADIGDVTQASALIEAVEKSFGQLDILVNNAGLTRDNLLMRLKDDDWDAVIDANLRGAFATCRAATRGMMKRRFGRIINVASVVGLTGNKGQANYAASKAGLIGMTKSIAKELASRNILANVVAPGFIETDMTAAMTPEARATLSANIPLERLGTPEDIASMVVVLASDLTSYVTGQVFVVDGGMVM